MSEGRGQPQRWPPHVATVVVALAAIGGFGAVYVTAGRPDNAPAAPSGAGPRTVVAETAAPAAAKLNTGHMAAFVYKKAPEAVAPISFTDGEGKTRSLQDWRGKVVLLNLWATWCAPCRKEMPALDRLQADLGSDRFEVMALAVDRVGAEGAKRFLDQINVGSLRLYVDATARASTELRAVGLPTTLLIDREGREVGRLTGPAEWDSPEAKRLVSALVGG